VIKSFFNKGTEDIFDRRVSAEARRTCPKNIWRVTQRKLDQLNAVVSLGNPSPSAWEPVGVTKTGPAWAAQYTNQ